MYNMHICQKVWSYEWACSWNFPCFLRNLRKKRHASLSYNWLLNKLIWFLKLPMSGLMRRQLPSSIPPQGSFATSVFYFGPELPGFAVCFPISNWISDYAEKRN